MVFPLQILWNLQLNRTRKISIMAIFGVGIVCIITSIIRVANIHSRAQSSQPAPSWLMLWAVIEAAVAVVVACMPTFGLLLPSPKNSTQGGFQSSTRCKIGYRERMQSNGIQLQSRASQHGFQGAVIEGNASKERLKMMEEHFSHNGVLVTTTLNIDGSTEADEDSSHKSSLPEHYDGHMV
ncbi:MAG: hypothetical protein Q9169_007521, partial [Polycauliona sp. 2 TL-2023]